MKKFYFPIIRKSLLNISGITILTALILLPSILFAQIDKSTRAAMHHEIMDDIYVHGSNNNAKTSPAYSSKGINFYMTQVNINDDGENILGDAGNEPSIAVDPINPNRMVMGWRQFDDVNNNFRQAGYGYTTDGGESWTFPGVIDPGIFRSDPVLDADANGNFYYNSLTVDGSSNYTCQVFKIEDGGVEWDNGTYAYGGDKQWMRIDNTDGIGAGNNYSFWTSYWSICNPGAFTRSTNFGNSYEECVEVDGDPSWGTLAVGPEGELYIVGAGDEYDIVVAKSTSAQDPALPVTWDSNVEVNLDGFLNGWTYVNPAGLLGQAWIDVDKSEGPGHGNVYVLASVERYSNNDPGDVMFSKSTDGGQTWSYPQRINDDLGTNDYQWLGTMSVAPNGRIDAVWLDTRDAPGSSVYSALYYSFSLDQGETWSINEKLSDSFDPHVGWPDQEKMGDYFDMVSDNEHAHLAWANTLNGEQDVYYGRITQVPVRISTPSKQNQMSLTCYPNPMKSKSTIRYNLPMNSHVKLGVYNIYGQQIKSLLSAEQNAGLHNLTFSADDLAEGIYFCRLQAGDHLETIRLVIVK